MTTLSPPPLHDNVVQLDPAASSRPRVRWSRRSKAVVAGGLSVLLVAGVLGASYETSPGGTLWGVEKAVFPDHAQDVALTAVVADLKKAQDILGAGQQPTADQLSDARTALNQAKQDLDYLSPSPQQASLQNLYLQLTQQLLQYTPDSAQQLPPLPVPAAPPVADPGSAPQAADVALTSATAPSWGYSDPTGNVGTIDQMSDNYVPPPAGIPDAPVADWPQPVAPPLTPNLGNLGSYDPSWGQLYGYNPGNWYNYGLNGYNQYGYDFLGFDRWGYDRSGYDRWGYDRWGYNWSGYNWSGYDRSGWDHDGWNEWGQRRDHPTDPRNQDWYDRHHAYQQYYQWKFENDDPVFHRTQWDHDHGFNPSQYQNWNMNRDWHNPRNRDWASAPAVKTSVDAHVSSPVVNLNTSLTQFISSDKATSAAGPLMKDLAGKSARDFTKDLTAPAAGPHDTAPRVAHQTPVTPPALTVAAPTAPPSKVSPGFTAPKLAPVPALKPSNVLAPQTDPRPSASPTVTAPKDADPSRVVAPADDPKPTTAHRRTVDPTPADAVPDPAPTGPAPAAPTSQAPKPPTAPVLQDAPAKPAVAPKTQLPTPEAQASESALAPAPKAPAPKSEVPAPKPAAPAPKAEAPAPKVQAPVTDTPVRQAPVKQAPPVQQAPVRQAPPPRAPAPAPPAPPAQPARQAPPARQTPPASNCPANQPVSAKCR